MFNYLIYRRLFYFTIFLFSFCLTYTQNENTKWYFGNAAGLDFMTNPPTILTNGMLNTFEGCASISNAAGSLLFYTDGITIYNASHAVMANGNGLTGHSSTAQSAVVVKRPGSSTIYYVFTLNQGGNANLDYSTVDMSLAAGAGSVTVKNIPLSTNNSEKLTSVRHCNGVDVWVLAHQSNSSTFRAYLVTSAGVNTTAVTSVAGTSTSVNFYCMKISPNGRKLAHSFGASSGNFELLDFDASTGMVSNPVALTTSLTSAYGVEFSPDGTKLYGSFYNSPIIYQWNLCAGSSTAIVASQVAINTIGNNKGAMQLATNGKIYVARTFQNALGVINNPNVAGTGCNFTETGQSISPKTSVYGLPNFITSGFKPPPPPFTHTVSLAFGCQTASFTAPFVAQNFSTTGCAASGYSLNGVLWNFGDPGSGATNTSTLTNPGHVFSALGTFTTSLILYYSCGGGTDTLYQVVNIPISCLSVSSTSITCSNLGSATVTSSGTGPFSYTWMPSGQTGSVATGLSPGTYTLTVFDVGTSFTYTTTTTLNSLIPLTGNLNNTSSLSCNGMATGTAGYTGIAGGSPNQFFYWSNGITTFSAVNNPSVATLSAGTWSATVVDALTGCTINDILLILQPPAFTVNIAASSPSACVGTSVTFTANTSGGTPGYSYAWLGGPASPNHTVSALLPGTVVYTVNIADAYSCQTSQTVSVDYINNPTLTVSNVSICPLQFGTLTASGASTYTWANNSNNSFFSASPATTTQYSVVGSAMGCTASATGSIAVKPLPVPVFSSNNGVCSGLNLNFSASGGTAYVWTGPLAFSSSASNNSIGNVSTANSGVYNLTITAANACTNSASYSLTVNPIPAVNASGGALCSNQSINLSSSSNPPATFLWTGPNGFSSTLQNPVLNNPPATASGNYVVKAVTANGCSNTAVANVTVTALPVLFPQGNGPKCVGDVLSLSANASGAAVFNWSGPNAFSSVLQNPVISNVSLAEAGIYTLMVTNGPCVVTRTTVPVIINALPSPTAISSGPVCETKKAFFTAYSSGAPIASYYWVGPFSFTSTVMAPDIASCSAINAGDYSVTVTDVNGCVGSAAVNLTVLKNPTITAVGATVCLNEPATLRVSGANTYQWSGNGMGLNGNDTLRIARAQNPVGSPVVYYVMGTAVNGCTAVTSASLFTLKLPVPMASVWPSEKQCVGSKFVFTGAGGMAYEWRGPGGIFAATQQFSVTASHPGMAGIYSLTAFDAMGCKAATNLAIELYPLPQGFVTASVPEGCVPVCTRLSFKPSPTATSTVSGIRWLVNNKTYEEDSVWVCFNRSGTYTASVKMNNGYNCSAQLSTQINVRPKPIANFSFEPEKPVERFETANFFNRSQGDSLTEFYWSVADNSGYTSKAQNPSYLFESSGAYPVALVVKNKWSCADTVVKVVHVAEDYNFFIPNSFTPNGDGVNDNFIPVCRGVREISFFVFNRWGQVLFSTNSLLQGWNGLYNGIACKNDIYAWKATVTSQNGTIKTYSGMVTLVR